MSGNPSQQPVQPRSTTTGVPNTSEVVDRVAAKMRPSGARSKKSSRPSPEMLGAPSSVFDLDRRRKVLRLAERYGRAASRLWGTLIRPRLATRGAAGIRMHTALRPFGAPRARRGSDSQADSHSVGHWQPAVNVGGFRLVSVDLEHTSLDSGGRQKRGLQNRLEPGPSRVL